MFRITNMYRIMYPDVPYASCTQMYRIMYPDEFVFLTLGLERKIRARGDTKVINSYQ